MQGKIKERWEELCAQAVRRVDEPGPKKGD